MPWLVHAAAQAAAPWEVPPDNLVAFADPSGSSDYRLLACDDQLGRHVFAFEHDQSRLTRTDLTLLDFLKEAWETAYSGLAQGAPRRWSVEFSVSARSDEHADHVIGHIAALRNTTSVTVPAWTARFVDMPEGVRWPTTPVAHYELRLLWEGEQIQVKKTLDRGQAGPKLVFTLSDPETELDSGRIVAVRRLLSDLGLTFNECDYGLRPSNNALSNREDS